MREDSSIHAAIAAKPESLKWNVNGWLKVLYPQQITGPLFKIGARPQTVLINRDLLAKHGPFLDKHGY